MESKAVLFFFRGSKSKLKKLSWFQRNTSVNSTIFWGGVLFSWFVFRGWRLEEVVYEHDVHFFPCPGSKPSDPHLGGFQMIFSGVKSDLHLD